KTDLALHLVHLVVRGAISIAIPFERTSPCLERGDLCPKLTKAILPRPRDLRGIDLESARDVHVAFGLEEGDLGKSRLPPTTEELVELGRTVRMEAVGGDFDADGDIGEHRSRRVGDDRADALDNRASFRATLRIVRARAQLLVVDRRLEELDPVGVARV